MRNSLLRRLVLPSLFVIAGGTLPCLSLAVAQNEVSQIANDRNDEFWQQIEQSALPSGYRGAKHQEFVDAQMAKLQPQKRERVIALWRERQKAHPPMSNPGASFVKIMMFVVSGETAESLRATPQKDWFRRDADDDAIVKSPADGDEDARKHGHPTLLSPHSDPLAIHGRTLFVVNTPADSLDVIDTKSKRIIARIPVGVDPVCVQVRPDGKEVWVANHISDSISVIDNEPQSMTYLSVVATIQDIDFRKKSTRFDEPSGIAFADNHKAYVSLATTNRIAVINVTSRKIVKHIDIPSQEPRLLRVRNGNLYVVPFESNNQTQLSGGRAADIDGLQVTFDAHKLADSFDSAGFTLDIVKHPDIPDRDLYVYETNNEELIRTTNSLGTLMYGFDVTDDGTVMIAHTEARNQVNGRAGTQKHGLKELDNRPYLNRVAVVPPQGEATFIHLNPLPPEQPDRETAIATPSAIHVAEKIAYVTAAGSDHLVTLDAKSGEVLGRVKVGAVPRGVVVEGKSAWVFNAVGNSVSEVDVSNPASPTTTGSIALVDPTSTRDKNGFAAFHTARASSNGTFSCASCHPDGHTDHLLWVLDTPHIVGADQIEPRLSQQLRGLRGTAPYHWDGVPGDPYGGANASTRERLPPNSDPDKPVSAVRHLIDGGMASTMLAHESDAVNDEGKKGYLSGAERDAMAEFLLNLNHKPARGRAYSDQLSDRALTGLERFHITGARDRPNLNTMVCGSCHTMPYLTTDQDSMNVPSFRGALDRFITQAQGRNSVISLGGVKKIAENGWAGEEVWKRMLAMGEPQRLHPVVDMFKETSTAFSGAFGRQVTLSSNTMDDPTILEMLPAIEKAAMQGTVVLRVAGTMLNQGKNSESVTMSFDVKSGRFVVDQLGGATYSHAELIELAEADQFVATFTAHHPVDVMAAPPAIWTIGSLHQQRGIQLFPRINEDRMSMIMSGRHVRRDASLFVNGRRIGGTIAVVGKDQLEVTLDALPPRGMNTLQVHNQNGYLSNDFIFFVESESEAIERYRREPDYLLTAILNSAIVNDNMEEALLALKAGAALNAPHEHFDLERPPLILAAMYGRGSLVKELLRRGAKPNIQDKDGTTALHEAARTGRIEICHLLLDAGANANSVNRWNERPADLTDRFIAEGSFENHFAPSRVNLTLDHQRYSRDRRAIEKLLANLDADQD